MRLTLLAALVALALPASAQTQFADSTGAFVVLNGLGFNSSGPFLVDATLGYRLSASTDVGVRALYGRDRYGLGTVAGTTWRLPGNLRLRAEGSALYQSYESAGLIGSTQERLLSRTLSGDASVTASRSLRLMGSLHLAPTVGVFAAGTRQLAFESSQDLPRPVDARLAAGLQIEAPLSFRLFGQTATVAPTLRYSLVGSPSNLHRLTGGTVFRLNF